MADCGVAMMLAIEKSMFISAFFTLFFAVLFDALFFI